MSFSSVDRQKDVKSLAKHLFEIHGLSSSWKFEFDHAKSRMGVCRHRSKVISLSKYCITNPKIPMKEIKNTLLHEIAHALVGHAHHHNHVWKSKAVEIGCTGQTCHTRVLTKYKYSIKCSCGQINTKRYKLHKNTRTLCCSHCSKRVSVRKL